MIRRGLLATLALLALSAAPAGAQTIDPSLFSTLDDPTVTPLTLTSIPMQVTGSIDVSFGPDITSGCAAHLGCAYSGRLSFSPGGTAQLTLTTYAARHRRRVEAELDFGALGGGGLTYADVRRSGGGECADAVSGGYLSAPVRGTSFTFSLADGLSQTRCAAPLASDLAGLLPRFVLTRADLRPGRRLDLHVAHSFAAHGFSGTVVSTISLTVGRASTVSLTGSGSPAGHKVRAVSVKLSLGGAAGSVALAVHGVSDTAVCSILDSCGLSGTETLSSHPVDSSGTLTAYGPVSRPRRDFLAALGLARGGNPHGISVIGSVVWHDLGSVSVNVRQAGICRDTAPLGDSLLIIIGTGRGLGVVAPDLGGHARCPGPVLGGLTTGSFGTVPAERSRGGDVTLALRPFGSLDDDGYTVTQHGSLTLRLHRGRVTDRVITSQLF